MTPLKERLSSKVWHSIRMEQDGNLRRVEIDGYRKILVVGFDSDQSNSFDPEWCPWGSGYAVDREFSYLGYSARISDWYLSERIAQDLARRRDEGFFADFDKVLFLGSSMGGFGALLHAAMVEGAYVAAFSPQSTLNPRIVDFDFRYGKALRLRWDDALHDAAPVPRDPARSFIFYDPFNAEDALHAERFDPAHVTHLKARHSRHYTFLYLNRMGIVQTLLDMILEDRLTETEFYALLRNRKVMNWHLNSISDLLKKKERPELAEWFGQAFKKNLSRNKDNLNNPTASQVL